MCQFKVNCVISLSSATLNLRDDNMRGSKLSLVDSEDGRSRRSKGKEKKKEKKQKQAVKK